MYNISFFESYNRNLELNNDIKNHLSQFPYLAYNIKDLNDGLEITFTKNLTNVKYLIGLLDPYKIDILSKNPIKIKATGKKRIDNFDQYKNKTIIENIELISLPDLKIENIKAKVDTGATCTSLGVSYVLTNRQTKKVTFIPLNTKFKQYTGKKITMDLYSEIRVQSSNGDEELRPLIKTDIKIKNKIYECFISLANRDELEYPILIGKDVLSGKFLINPGI